MTDSTLPYQFQQSLEPWAVKRLGGFAAVNDDIEQFRALDGGHGPNLGLLRFKGNALFCLPICGHPNVTNGLHVS
jgi:hypothetical protein